MPVLFAISSKFDGRWERILLSQFLKTSCIESFHLVELFCKFMTFLSWLMGFGKIILHQKGAVMNSFYFFSYLFRFVHFFLKFAPMGGLPRSQRVRPSAASPVGSKVLYIKFRCEPRRIARPHKAQNGQ